MFWWPVLISGRVTGFDLLGLKFIGRNPIGPIRSCLRFFKVSSSSSLYTNDDGRGRCGGEVVGDPRERGAGGGYGESGGGGE